MKNYELSDNDPWGQTTEEEFFAQAEKKAREEKSAEKKAPAISRQPRALTCVTGTVSTWGIPIKKGVVDNLETRKYKRSFHAFYVERKWLEIGLNALCHVAQGSDTKSDPLSGFRLLRGVQSLQA